MLSNKNCVNEPQDTEIKKLIINFINKVKEFKEFNKKQYNKHKENGNKHLSVAQENTHGCMQWQRPPRI